MYCIYSLFRRPMIISLSMSWILLLLLLLQLLELILLPLLVLLLYYTINAMITTATEISLIIHILLILLVVLLQSTFILFYYHKALTPHFSALTRLALLIWYLQASWTTLLKKSYSNTIVHALYSWQEWALQQTAQIHWCEYPSNVLVTHINRLTSLYAYVEIQMKLSYT